MPRSRAANEGIEQYLKLAVRCYHQPWMLMLCHSELNSSLSTRLSLRKFNNSMRCDVTTVNFFQWCIFIYFLRGMHSSPAIQRLLSHHIASHFGEPFFLLVIILVSSFISLWTHSVCVWCEAPLQHLENASWLFSIFVFSPMSHFLISFYCVKWPQR